MLSSLPLLQWPPPSSQLTLTLTHVGAVLLREQTEKSDLNSSGKIQIPGLDRTKTPLQADGLSYLSLPPAPSF